MSFLKNLWSKIKVPFTWLNKIRNQFNSWVASHLEGWKTKIIAAIGAIGSFAALAQQYVTGLPLEKYVTGDHLLIITGVLFTLAFWFRALADRE